jgi:hypothetical protein
MTGHIDQVLNVAKRYRRPWIVIPIFALMAFALTQLILRAIHGRDLQYGSREQITQILLEATPRGTPRENIRRFVASNGWRRGGLVFGPSPDQDPVDRISVHLGKARGFIVDEEVFAEWIFDAEDKLVDVRVHKLTLLP